MNGWYDDTRGSSTIDDASIEALLRGSPVPAELAPVATAVGMLRTAATRPVQPSAALAERIFSGDFSDVEPYEPSALTPGVHRRRRQLTPRAKAIAGLLVGLSGLTVGTAANALPGDIEDQVKEAARAAVEFLTPIDFSDEPAADEDTQEGGEEDFGNPLPGPAIDQTETPATPTGTPTPTPSPTPTPTTPSPTPTPTAEGALPADQTDLPDGTSPDGSTPSPSPSPGEPTPTTTVEPDLPGLDGGVPGLPEGIPPGLADADLPGKALRQISGP